MTTYYVQSRDANNNLGIVGHSEDEETKEVYYKFMDKAKARKLMDEERKVSPEKMYRIVKETVTFAPVTSWE